MSSSQVDSIQLTAWMTLIILAEIAGFVIGFLQNDSGPAFNVYGYSYSVAKGAARSIQVCLLLCKNGYCSALKSDLKPEQSDLA